MSNVWATSRKVYKRCTLHYAEDGGGRQTTDNKIEPIWSAGPILPSSLIDLIEKTANEVEDVVEIEEQSLIDYKDDADDDK